MNYILSLVLLFSFAAHAQETLTLAMPKALEFIKVEIRDGQQVKGKTFRSAGGSFVRLLQDAAAAKGKTVTVPLAILQLPFAHLPLKSLGLGLTYADHAQEVKVSDIVMFEKNAAPKRIQDEIPFRPHLDYEAEVGLLLHRSEPALFGYFIHNDLTDRMIQALNFDAGNPAPSFSQAKSFPGSSGNAPLLVIGGEEVWSTLRVDLAVNGDKRQTVEPAKNLLTPKQIHAKVFADPGLTADWVMIGTGTPAGTVFVAPGTWRKLWLFVSSGFSMTRAKKNWVKSFHFLQPGDRLSFTSDTLGNYEATVGPQ